MDRHECRASEEALDRDAWLKAWRRARHARSKGRPAPTDHASRLATTALEARTFGDRRAWIAQEHGRLVHEHGYRHSWRGLLEAIA